MTLAALKAARLKRANARELRRIEVEVRRLSLPVYGLPSEIDCRRGWSMSRSQGRVEGNPATIVCLGLSHNLVGKDARSVDTYVSIKHDGLVARPVDDWSTKGAFVGERYVSDGAMRAQMRVVRLRVDGEPLPFNTLDGLDEGAASTHLFALHALTVWSYNVAPESIALVRIHDLTPYVMRG